MLQERRQRVELLHRLDQLLEVLQPARGVGRALGLPHRGIAALVQDDLGQLARAVVARQRPPAVEGRDQLGQGVAGAGRQLVGLAQGARGLEHAGLAGARRRAHAAQGAVADAAPRQVDDPLQGQIVVGLADDAEIGDRVADLGPLVEARAADHPVGDAQLDEPLLEGAGLEAGPDQHRRLAELAALPLPGLDLVGDEGGLLLVVPQAGDLDLLALLALGPQRLAVPAAVARDHARGRAQDVPGRAVVALEADDRGTREILLEAQDVADLGPAPAVDRLVVVADAGDVLVAGGEQPQPEILGDVGVLVLVDQDRAEPLLVARQQLRLLRQQRQAVQQQVAEVAGVQRREALLVGGVERARRGPARSRRPRRPAPGPAGSRGPSSAGSWRPAGAAASGARRDRRPG